MVAGVTGLDMHEEGMYEKRIIRTFLLQEKLSAILLGKVIGLYVCKYLSESGGDTQMINQWRKASSGNQVA